MLRRTAAKSWSCLGFAQFYRQQISRNSQVIRIKTIQCRVSKETWARAKNILFLRRHDSFMGHSGQNKETREWASDKNNTNSILYRP